MEQVRTQREIIIMFPNSRGWVPYLHMARLTPLWQFYSPTPGIHLIPDDQGKAYFDKRKEEGLIFELTPHMAWTEGR